MFPYRTSSRTRLVATTQFQSLELHLQLTYVQCSTRTKQTRLAGTDPLAVNTGLPTDYSSYLVPNGVCHFTDEFVISKDGLPPTSRGALKRTQCYNHGKLLNPTFSMTNLDLGRLFLLFSRSPIL
ncbi:hypothetical protein V6N12_002794 [Hibiscus sabdariffa]|uniref:Uncharacterized protein n=1 Tax=Hibiscus sabdariffa TaxID=183260 RepID=A0ABR2EBJ8_9ROSI